MEDAPKSSRARFPRIDHTNYAQYLSARSDELRQEFKVNLREGILQLTYDFLVDLEQIEQHIADWFRDYQQRSISDNWRFGTHRPIPIALDLGWFILTQVESGRSTDGETLIGIHVEYEYSASWLEWGGGHDVHSTNCPLGIGILITLTRVAPDQVRMRAVHGHPVLGHITECVARATPSKWRDDPAKSEEPVYFHLRDFAQLEPVSSESEEFRADENPTFERQYGAWTGAQTGAPSAAFPKEKRREIALKWLEAKKRGGVLQANFAEQWGISASTLRKYVHQLLEGTLDP